MDLTHDQILSLSGALLLLLVGVLGKPAERFKAALAMAKIRASSEATAINALAARCNAVEGRMDTALGKLDDLKEQNRELKAQNAKLSAQNAELREQNEALRQQKSALAAQVEQLQERVSALELQRIEGQVVIEQLSADLLESREELATAQIGLAEVRAKCPRCPVAKAKAAKKKGAKKS
jgi:chromosome segregation ATPase